MNPRKNANSTPPSGQANNAKRVKLDLAHLTVGRPPSGREGQLYMMGLGGCGQLSFEAQQRNYPALVPALEKEKVTQVAAGGMHSVVLTAKGEVYTFGCNDDSALGRETEDDEEEREPAAVSFGQPGTRTMVQVTAGDSHSAALSDDGSVFVWGSFKNNEGYMGIIHNSDEVKLLQPQLILDHTKIKKIVKIASGVHHLVMLAQDGSVFTCGAGAQGQLGRVKPRTTRAHPTEVPDREFWLNPGQVEFRSGQVCTDIWTGHYATFCRLANGSVLAFGLNNYMQLGERSKQTTSFEDNIIPRPKLTKGLNAPGLKWTKVSGGEHHTLLLNEEGKVYAMGRHDDGRLGMGEEVTSALWEPKIVDNLATTTCTDVACGTATAVSYATATDGTLFTWGFGENRQLGQGSGDDVFVPVRCLRQKKDPKTAVPHYIQQVLLASPGGQHSAMIVNVNDENSNETC